MLHYLYERLLELQITRAHQPECVAIVLSSGDLDLKGMMHMRDLVEWSDALGIKSLAVHINDNTPEIRERIARLLSDVPAEICLHTKDCMKTIGLGGRIKVAISLGFGGKREVTEAIRKLLEGVEEGLVNPEEIDEETIEMNLRLRQKPDLVIRAGGSQLSDFMIWQSAYSELYFTEVNWRSLRKIDFLRAIRDYQQRERRFGR